MRICGQCPTCLRVNSSLTSTISTHMPLTPIEKTLNYICLDCGARWNETFHMTNVSLMKSVLSRASSTQQELEAENVVLRARLREVELLLGWFSIHLRKTFGMGGPLAKAADYNFSRIIDKLEEVDTFFKLKCK